jgi:hypothetical protein
MASTGPATSLNRKQILANIQGRGSNESPEENAEVAARDDAAERILFKPVKSKSTARRPKAKKPKGQSTTQIVLLAVIGLTGLAAIIGLRYLAEAFGVNWVGD